MVGMQGGGGGMNQMNNTMVQGQARWPVGGAETGHGAIAR